MALWQCPIHRAPLPCPLPCRAVHALPHAAYPNGNVSRWHLRSAGFGIEFDMVKGKGPVIANPMRSTEQLKALT